MSRFESELTRRMSTRPITGEEVDLFTFLDEWMTAKGGVELGKAWLNLWNQYVLVKHDNEVREAEIRRELSMSDEFARDQHGCKESEAAE